MLRSNTATRDNGKFELIVMLALAGFSFTGAPAVIVVGVGGVVLTVSTLYEYGHLRPRFARIGATRVIAGGVLGTAALSLAFASLCYAVGRFVAWLIAP